MARAANVVDQAINLMEKIEKTRLSAIKELLALRGKIDSQLGKLGYAGMATPVVSAGKTRRAAASATAAPRRLVSEETRQKMLKAQQERRKRENQAKLAAEKNPPKQPKVKKASSKTAKTNPKTETASQG
jgi:hypothetical protein